MKLGDLRKALRRFPPDMDDLEMTLQVSRNSRIQYELLCFVGYAENVQCFVLGGESAIKNMIADGKINADEYNSTSEEGFVEPPQ